MRNYSRSRSKARTASAPDTTGFSCSSAAWIDESEAVPNNCISQHTRRNYLCQQGKFQLEGASEGKAEAPAPPGHVPLALPSEIAYIGVRRTVLVKKNH